MKLALACVAAAVLLSGCAGQSDDEDAKAVPPAAEAVRVVEPPLMSLPDPRREGFRSGPYIRAAVRLQGLGREAATKALGQLARNEGEGQRTIILCRMLFTKKPGGEFRGPMLGSPGVPEEADLADWPLDPIEVVDGVPFLIIGYVFLSGVPESGEQYLAYCLAECDWGGFRYAPRTAAEKKKALDKLVRTKKMKKLLEYYEPDFLPDFLSKQVE